MTSSPRAQQTQDIFQMLLNTIGLTEVFPIFRQYSRYFLKILINQLSSSNVVLVVTHIQHFADFLFPGCKHLPLSVKHL